MFQVLMHNPVAVVIVAAVGVYLAGTLANASKRYNGLW